MAAPIRIDIFDMYLRDQRALDILRENADPKTSIAKISLPKLAEALGCHHNTAKQIAKRLAGGGHIIKHGTTRGFYIEVLPPLIDDKIGA